MTRGAVLRATGTAVVTAILLAACSGGSGEGQTKAAQARVDAKQRAVSKAQQELTDAKSAFCGGASAYITALDRYGDVLNATAPTVGDVKDAGADLEAPRQGALDDAEAAVEAQQRLATAERELAEATAALAALKPSPGASGVVTATTSTASPSGSASPTPLAPPATVNRVKTAESEFRTASAGITDQTPLRQAAQHFNAAAVALEMSWLTLFVDAGCVTDERQKEAQAAVEAYTVALQTSLQTAGYYRGEIDGVYGPTTVDAVEAVQKAHGLPVTGTVDKATSAALQADVQAKGGQAAQQALASTAAVQQTLKLAGFWTGPVDGQWTPALTEALMAFQTALGVPPTGTVDAATVGALEKALARPPQSSTPTPPSSAAPPTSPTPTSS
jgi:murein L,D-transpeptidase YcbB/YkuD